MDDPTSAPRLSSGPARLLWLLVGLLSLGLGLLGVVVPGLPTTIFLIIAAGCFARCSPRLEQWVLITLACGTSAGIFIDPLWVRLLVVAVGLVGIGYVGWRVPTRERVLGEG